MHKNLLVLILLVMMSSLIIAQETVKVKPYETVKLPSITSSIEPDNEGLSRTYLYCSWRVRDKGELAGLMTSTKCPEKDQSYKFTDDTDYYVSIDYAKIVYGEVNKKWEIVETGNINRSLISYVIDVEEPPKELLGTIYETILNKIKMLVCKIFPFLKICSN